MKALEKALEIDENLAMAYATRGYLKFMVNWDLVGAEQDFRKAFDEASIYAGLREKDKAFELLYKLYENHSSDILLLVGDYGLHSLHDDPRFEDLRRKVGFPEVQSPVKER